MSFPVTLKLPLEERSASPSVVELVSAKVMLPNSRSLGKVILIADPLAIGYFGPMKNLSL